MRTWRASRSVFSSYGVFRRWFGRLGLQRRIMLYVAVGLVLMFAIGAYVGLLAIHQATDLVYRERQSTAFVTAGMLDQNLRDIAHNVEFVRSRLLRTNPPEGLEEIGQELLAEVSHSSSPFVRTQDLFLIDWRSGAQVTVPSSGGAPPRSIPTSILAATQETSIIGPAASAGGPYFGSIVIPIRDDAGGLCWIVVLHLAALNSGEPYSLDQEGANQVGVVPDKSALSYGLEVLGPDGTVALTKRGGAAPGTLSVHWQILQQHAPQPRGPFVFLHTPAKGQGFPPHVIAAAPLSAGPFVVILEQREDVALELPLRLRQRLIWFATAGFAAAMIGAWLTTRHVVKPTERLTAAAQRIAAGEVETPLEVVAQDEIGRLAESLETMRLRLQAWGSELEKQVRDRTSELEQRNRQLADLYGTLQRNERQLRALLERVLRAQEDERKRVSRELHDEIGQALSALTMGLESLEHATPEQWTTSVGQVERLRELAKETLSDLRRLTVALRPAALDDLGLVPAIRRYAELYLGDAGVDFDVREESTGERFDPSLETVIYRVIQEAINNVARHSHASRVRISLGPVDHTLVATVEDNGVGFDPSISREEVGLEGMRERASLAGGRLTIQSQPGHGTTVRLEIPLPGKVGALRHA